MCNRFMPLVAATLMLAGNALAQSPGDWSVRTGVGYLSTDVDSGNLRLEGTEFDGFRIDVDNNFRPTMSVSVMWTENIAFEVMGAAPFSLRIDGDGAVEGLGRLGTTNLLPINFSVLWHFNPGGLTRPYAGVGLNHSYFHSESTTDALHQGIVSAINQTRGTNYSGGTSFMDIGSSTGLALQLGIDFVLEGNWYANVEVRKFRIEADTRIQTRTSDPAGNPAIFVSNLRADLDPWLFGASVGYRF